MRALLRPWRSLTRSPLRRALFILGAALGVVGWLALAPTALGGSSTYVTTYGTSMEPALHRGDLAIVRAQPSYSVGDVVAYRSESLHTIVLHRIIGRDGDRFVFKGDNNTWVDSDHPPASALVGKMETRLPGFGTHVQRAASPPGLATLGALAVLPVATKRGRSRRRRRDDGSGEPLRAPRRRPSLGHVTPPLLVVTALVFGALAFAFTRPVTVHTTAICHSMIVVSSRTRVRRRAGVRCTKPSRSHRDSRSSSTSSIGWMSTSPIARPRLRRSLPRVTSRSARR